MSAVDTLESVAALLPPERRERFLRMAATFRTVPEDDEYLQMLEAIGFMTLLWREVPREIRRVLEGANPVSETCESVAVQVRAAVIEAIPSYEDLKQISQRLEGHDLTLSRLLAQCSPAPSSQPRLLGPWITFATGIAVGVIACHLAPFLASLLP